ncbi:hypothetical protein [Pseudooctadecabacter jejudonensis]|uniref:Uncharacterized protein n=1 Tax=Pseudooctadecabacter jejudonensis TaxID=1391910 RepID=A0A1Y5TEM4_9RHOB|nr:hypothetical protein [Pseudooctadecabacter jejudonensis]SLN62322.1 hypothetical protein PSJ8397_03310 [Pseudooctadecabacter jejudonensis]
MTSQFATWVPVLVTLGILIWGLRLLSAILLAPNVQTTRPMLASALTEKKDPENGISFSRVSGAIGSIGLAAFMSGLGLWVFFALNDGSMLTVADTTTGADDTVDPTTGHGVAGSPLARLRELEVYLWGSAALFAPYAANQINGLFSGKK